MSHKGIFVIIILLSVISIGIYSTTSSTVQPIQHKQSIFDGTKIVDTFEADKQFIGNGTNHRIVLNDGVTSTSVP